MLAVAREWPSLRAARISATGTIPSGRRPATDATSRRAQCRWPSTAVKDGGAAGRASGAGNSGRAPVVREVGATCAWAIACLPMQKGAGRGAWREG